MNKVALLAFSFIVAACSNKSVYDSVQNDQRWQCDQEPISTQDECRERASRSYEDYERERQGILNED